MDPTIIVEDTERTQICPQKEGQTDRRTDNVKPVYTSPPPPQHTHTHFQKQGGIMMI